MNQSQSKTIGYAVAGLGGLTLLLIIAWLALRETQPSSPDLPPVRSVTVSPRVPPVASDNAAPQETPTNTVTESAPIPTNAATLYGQAFAIFDALSKDQKELLKDWRTNVDASVATELCEKIQPICDLMHQAAVATNCDWGLEQPVTFNTLLPHLNPCRNLARAAVWSVAHCRTNDPSAAIDNLLATSRLGQNVSAPMLICHLVDLSIQGMVIDSVTEHASTLANTGDGRLMELFNAVNYNGGLRHAIEQEADMLAREMDRLATVSPEEIMGELKSVTSDSRFESMEPTQVIADLRQAVELQRQYAKALELTDTDYREWQAGLQAVRKTNLFANYFLSPIESVINQTQAMTVKSAMAAAGLTAIQDGTDALPSHPDPTTGQPFAYKQTLDGFELESSFQFKDKPLTLSFK